MAVGDDLDGGVGAVFDAEVAGNGDGGPAEVAGTGLEDGGPQSGVEGLAGLVAESDEDGDVVLGVA